jgi:hypothetical protein
MLFCIHMIMKVDIRLKKKYRHTKKIEKEVTKKNLDLKRKKYYRIIMNVSKMLVACNITLNYI